MFPDDFTQVSAIFRTMSGLSQLIMQPQVRNLSGNKLIATLPMWFLRVNEFSVRPLIGAARDFPWTGTSMLAPTPSPHVNCLDTRVHGI
jgi:hypothetical protein